MSASSDSCKDGASKSNDGDGVCEVNDMLQNMCTADDNSASACANCSKEGDDVNNTCNKCKMVKYCNAACKKKHRHKHKKECEEHARLAAERAAKLHDEGLFKQPPPQEQDCPICFLRLPTLETGWRYQSCCGKIVCSGCCYAPVYDNQGNKVDKKCPYCRTPMPVSDEEIVERGKIRVEANDPIAIYNLGCDYRDGTCGYPKDYSKALEFYHRSGEIGYAEAYSNIGWAYNNGEGVEVDKKKATYYFELAAIGGEVNARHNLDICEKDEGNVDRSLKHWMIAVRGGYTDSLKMIQKMYNNGQATKEDYTKALRSYQEYLGEIKSVQRDKAAQSDERFRYF